jgi:hypothetical protein
VSTVAPARGEYELQTAHADGPPLDTAQAIFIKQGHDLTWIDVATTVKARKQAPCKCRC